MRGAYPHTRLSGLGVGVPHRSNAIGFFVEKDDVGDVADFGAFVTDVFFNVENCGGVFLWGVLGGFSGWE